MCITLESFLTILVWTELQLGVNECIVKHHVFLYKIIFMNIYVLMTYLLLPQLHLIPFIVRSKMSKKETTNKYTWSIITTNEKHMKIWNVNWDCRRIYESALKIDYILFSVVFFSLSLCFLHSNSAKMCICK